MLFSQNRSALSYALQELKATEEHGLQALASQPLKVQSRKRDLLVLYNAALHSLFGADPGDGPPAGNKIFATATPGMT